jgi:hypothetical protein
MWIDCIILYCRKTEQSNEQDMCTPQQLSQWNSPGRWFHYGPFHISCKWCQQCTMSAHVHTTHILNTTMDLEQIVPHYHNFRNSQSFKCQKDKPHWLYFLPVSCGHHMLQRQTSLWVWPASPYQSIHSSGNIRPHPGLSGGMVFLKCHRNWTQ